MKKSIFLLATLLVAFGACTTREAQPEQVSEPKTITFKARIADPDPDTRVSFTEATEGIKSTFEAEDVVYLFDAEGNMTPFNVTDVDDNGVATFSGTPETEIAEGAAVTAVVKNAALSIDAESKTATVNLNNQAGTLASAAAHNLLFASGTYSEQGVSLVFEHKTSLLKLTLSLPEAETATSVKDFYLITVPDRANVTDQNGAQFNYCNYVSVDQTGTVTNGKNGTGWINWTTAAAVENHTVTLYLSVPAIDLKFAALQCTPNSDAQKRYFWNLAGSSPLTIEAGKAYKITRTQAQFAPSAKGSTFFFSNEAQTYEFGLPQGDIVTYETSTGDWLTKETDANGNMRIRMTANTTGSPRESTLTFKVFGAFCKYSVTQAEVSDFSGDWTLNAKEFLSKATTKTITQEGSRYFDGSWATTTTNAKSIPVSISYLANQEPVTGRESKTTLTKVDVDRTNNLSISGIYRNILLKSSVDINYENHTASYGLFLDMSTVQPIEGGTYDGEYATFAPELCYAANSKWEFGAGSLGAPNKIWWMGTISVSGNTTTIKFGYLTHYLTTGTSYQLKIAGILLDRFNSNQPGAATLIRSKSSTYVNSTFGYGAAYAQALQANYNNVENNGLQLVKSASSTSPADINITPVENTAW